MRIQRRALGSFGERAAAGHLRKQGCRVVDANFRTREGELDIVFVDRSALVFCEVKTRVEEPGGAVMPSESVGYFKQQRLRRMAGRWLAQAGRDARPGTARGEIRFDVIGVHVSPGLKVTKIDHIKNAFY